MYLFGACLSYTVSSAIAVNHLGEPFPVAAARKVVLYCPEVRVASDRRIQNEESLLIRCTVSKYSLDPTQPYCTSKQGSARHKGGGHSAEIRIWFTKEHTGP